MLQDCPVLRKSSNPYVRPLFLQSESGSLRLQSETSGGVKQSLRNRHETPCVPLQVPETGRLGGEAGGSSQRTGQGQAQHSEAGPESVGLPWRGMEERATITPLL